MSSSWRARDQHFLLDANLLVLAAVGRLDKSLIGRKRLDIFTQNDFELVLRLIGAHIRWLTTPHVLAEVGNLADQCVPDVQHRRFRILLREIIAQLEEHWAPATELYKSDHFSRLGLTDAAISRLAGDGATVVSTDFQLCGLLASRGVKAHTFAEIRNL